ncbi:hypothetical protein J2S43_005236 [Catenuloplanes nepalensis]|uniref:Exo-alpha-sialidase n=1 Tax=Catenuloplanes nepalensis TaxID=587533 RepID=A0ABT9MZ58_9ACTN|nr:hypothetical protein [Catenuloplanes nepalensis]MDP9796724.1 hypothetical protein [Catenuloplanes nepalensis]
MADRLEDAFARFEASATPLFQPAPVSALPAMIRGRRHRWAGLLAGALVLLVGGPAGAFAVASSGPDGPVPQPPGIPNREHLREPQFGFAPGTIWTYSDGLCTDDGCRPSQLASSADQGRTWQVRPGAEGFQDAQLIVSPRGDIFLREPGDTVHQVLPESGASILTPSRPGPPELLLENGGDLILRCPDEQTYGGPDALACDRPEVADLTKPFAVAAPEGMGRLTQLARDGKGRVWLLGRDPDSGTFWLSSSADDGETWDTPVRKEGPPGGVRLTVSPVDSDAWIVAGDPVRVWRLGHDAEHLIVADGDGRTVADHAGGVASEGEGTQFDAAEPSMVRALGFGVLVAATPDAGLWIFQPDAGRMPVEEDFTAVSMDVLADGTLVVRDAAGRFGVGAGQGWERTWAWPEP